MLKTADPPPTQLEVGVMRHTFRIVVGVDGSRQGQRALDWAVSEAAGRDRAGQPAVVQAVTAWQADTLAQPVGAGANIADPREAAAAALHAAVAAVRVKHPDVTVAGVVIEGPAAEVLGRAADDADLLVLGDHGHGPLYHAVLGSVTEACIRSAICPVVVIPTARSSSTTFAHESLATTAG
jgi:nucleotide-binding universal stress UspA family protein